MLKSRKLYSALVGHLNDKRHTIITGSRQVGKSSLLKKLYKHLQDGHQKVFFINLENKNILDAINSDADAIFDFTTETPEKSLLTNTKGLIVYLLIDEIQYLSNPTRFLKYLYDEYQENVKIVATGSSAFYMDRKFNDSLAGRKRIFHLHPLSFLEYLDFNNKPALIKELSFINNKKNYKSLLLTQIQGQLHEYLTYGGYPAVVLEKNKQEKIWLLEELKNSYVKRDMFEAGIEKEEKFYTLLQILADQVGNMVNKNELSNTLRIDGKTIDNYLYVLQKSFHVYLIKPFHKNIRKELTKMPKLYFNDIGLRNALLNRFETPSLRADKGQLLENFMFGQFRYVYQTDQIKYWRTTAGKEIDFVIEESYIQGKAFEVKWNKSQFNTKRYKEFLQTYAAFSIECIDVNNYDLLNI